MQKYLFFLLLPLIGWISACKTPEKKAVYTPENIIPTEKALVWKISGNKLKKPSYLYGTIHVIPKADFALPEPIKTVLPDMKCVTFEIDMAEMTNLVAQFSLLTKAFMANGKKLKDVMPADDYAFVKEKMKERGLPGGMFERIKPMFLSMMFTGGEDGPTSGGSARKMTSVEMELYNAARKRRIASDGLETASYQMSIFDSIPYEIQAKMLVKTLQADNVASEGANELDKMLEMYKNQDIQAMQNIVSDDDSGIGPYEDLLLNQRNRNWIPVMGRMMRLKPTLFAVGAGHLGGKEGVIALLRKEGYSVEAVQ
jgi:uncharacterized protein